MGALDGAAEATAEGGTEGFGVARWDGAEARTETAYPMVSGCPGKGIGRHEVVASVTSLGSEENLRCPSKQRLETTQEKITHFFPRRFLNPMMVLGAFLTS